MKDRKEASVEDDDIKDFLKKELMRAVLLILCPMWRMEWRSEKTNLFLT